MSSEAWIGSADRALALAADEIKLIRAMTPSNAAAELVGLEQAFRRGSPRLPRWEYDPAPPPRPELTLALERLADFLEAASPLGRVYAARARELGLEAAMIERVGSPTLGELAVRRFAGDSPQDLEVADALAERWAGETASGEGHGGGVLIRTCDAQHPSSLVSVMSREAGRAKLPVRVVVQPGLASLAATGDGAILVAEGKWIGQRDVDRTVLHEIAGHALPRARAESMALGIYAVGTARGIDDQEGRALLIEESAGFLDAPRRRELGL
ncbi:MAG TPA: tyrosine/phenylalanine carboxypeptidase domain-containing protein, partial [Polyangiaceae bacterium]|nr:tyrosine/phenylalanine carboxypeptidase domain-containing protein [Polyangiaceae bacterium]